MNEPDPDELPETRQRLRAAGDIARKLRAVKNAISTGVESGCVIGDYTLVRLIGKGGMGQVWEAHEGSLNRKVALKLMLPGRVDERALRFFAREGRAGGRLEHPGIVSVYAAGEADGVWYIAEELVEGDTTLADTLDARAKEPELPPSYYRKVGDFFAKLADGLQAAHDAGVIHRDIKPRNILVTLNGDPKITDFGLARLTDEKSLSAVGDFAGTYAYMSPEQLTLKHLAIDHRTDIFSLGVVLYEALGLTRSFAGDSRQQVMQKILFEDPPDLRSHRSKIPRDLAVICGKAMEKVKGNRYATMEKFAADIRRYLSNKPILARPPATWQRMAKWVKRHPTASGIVAVGTTALLVISLLLEANLREIASVKRLSALQNYDRLILEVTRLWPPHPENIEFYREWIDNARDLVDDLPHHYAKQHELRSLALPQTDEEREADRLSHPGFDQLQNLLGEIKFRRAALLQRRDGVEMEQPVLARESLPDNATQLNALAWTWVDPDRETYGRESEGLVLARRALELAEAAADDTLSAVVGDTLSRALFSLSRDGEALEASRAAIAVAPEEIREEYEGYLSDLEGWVEKARSEEGLRSAEEALARLEAEAVVLEARVSERWIWRFPKTQEGREARWWHVNLTKLIDSLEGLSGARTGLLSEAEDAVSNGHGWSVPRRLAFANRLRDGLAEGGEWDDRWGEAVAAIREHPKYGGLELSPQVGLVPIGPDPKSALWEFWHVAAGVEPVRGDDGKLVVTEQTGLVLVLIPGGTFWMGATADLNAPNNYDEQAIVNEGPVNEMTLSAYFLSKYEMTQGQWQRLTGKNPSFFSAGLPNERAIEQFGPPSTLRDPVEFITWIECTRELERCGLSLPTEAQWEFGARAGTSTPWYCKRGELANHENLKDAYFHLMETENGIEDDEYEEFLNDGHYLHAPTGSLASNPFGLHDVLGNVSEWCRDKPETYYWPALAPDGERYPDPYSIINVKATRGASYDDLARDARAALRSGEPATFKHRFIGVRPARAVDF